MKSLTRLLAGLAPVLCVACGGDDVTDPGETNEEEVITTVTLTFQPTGGGNTIEASFRDADGDGGDAPTVDAIELADGTTYELTVQFLNELESPAEDITEEIEEEAEEHQVFFTGSAVEGPATGTNGDAIITHAYSDVESDYGANAEGGDYPVGLANEFVATGTGTGTLTVTLRHLPAVNMTPVKTGTLAEDVATGGLTSLPGETDVSVDFDVTVQ